MSGFSVTMADRDRRALLAGLVTIASLLLVFRGLPAWAEWSSAAQSSAMAARAEHARKQAVLAILPQAMDTLEARVGRVRALAPSLLVATEADEARQALVAVLGERARLARVELTDLDASVDTAESNVVPTLLAEGAGSGDILGLHQFLWRLEQTSPPLVVEVLEVVPSDPTSPSTSPEVLSFSFTVRGLAFLRPAQGRGRDGPS